MKKPVIHYEIKDHGPNDSGEMVIFAELMSPRTDMVYQRRVALANFDSFKDPANYLMEALECIVRSFGRIDGEHSRDCEKRNVIMDLTPHKKFKHDFPEVFDSLVQALGHARFLAKVGGKKVELAHG